MPPSPPVSSRRWLVMGVSGSGKTTLGRAWAERLGQPFFDADDYHPPANVDKMSRALPLTDADRLPWLDSLNRLLRETPGAVLACSALKQSYRDRLGDGVADLCVAHLQVDRETLQQRMLARDHFMPADLLHSQLDTLEPPSADRAIILDGRRRIPQLVADLSRIASIAD